MELAELLVISLKFFPHGSIALGSDFVTTFIIQVFLCFIQSYFSLHFTDLDFNVSLLGYFLVGVVCRSLLSCVWDKSVTAIETIYDVVVVAVLVGLCHDFGQTVHPMSIDFFHSEATHCAWFGQAD